MRNNILKARRRAKLINTTFLILADGLDAMVDGRGWGIEHEEAKNLANAAPQLCAVTKEFKKYVSYCLVSGRWDDIDWPALIEQAEKALPPSKKQRRKNK